MDVHSAPVVGNRMWSYLRAVFFMMRKSKRKLLLGMHLLMKRRNKALARSVANLLSHHHHHGHALRRRDYEFSCSDGPDTAGSFSMRHPLAYLPCLGSEVQEEPLHTEPAPSATPPLHRIEYYAAASPAPSSPGDVTMHEEELAPGEEMECTPGRMSPLVPSGGFSVRVSNFSSEELDGVQDMGGEAVDDDAEEFIARFYEQLRRQNQTGLLPYHLQEQESAA